jgi:hypothetical protein
METLSGSNPPRYPPNPIQVSKEVTFHLRIRSAKEALTVLKWLLTKFYRNGKEYSEEEIIVLHLLAEYFNSYRNKGFYNSNGLEFLKLRALARITILDPERRDSAQRSIEKLLLAQDILFSPRAFLGLPLKSCRQLLGRRNRRLERKPTGEPRRIGVGYRDKGSTTQVYIDGSPQWGEVATSDLVRFGLLREVPEEWWRVSHFFE